eukprot:208027_1
MTESTQAETTDPSSNDANQQNNDDNDAKQEIQENEAPTTSEKLKVYDPIEHISSDTGYKDKDFHCPAIINGSNTKHVKAIYHTNGQVMMWEMDIKAEDHSDPTKTVHNSEKYTFSSIFVKQIENSRSKVQFASGNHKNAAAYKTLYNEICGKSAKISTYKKFAQFVKDRYEEQPVKVVNGKIMVDDGPIVDLKKIVYYANNENKIHAQRGITWGEFMNGRKGVLDYLIEQEVIKSEERQKVSEGGAIYICDSIDPSDRNMRALTSGEPKWIDQYIFPIELMDIQNIKYFGKRKSNKDKEFKSTCTVVDILGLICYYTHTYTSKQYDGTETQPSQHVSNTPITFQKSLNNLKAPINEVPPDLSLKKTDQNVFASYLEQIAKDKNQENKDENKENTNNTNNVNPSSTAVTQPSGPSEQVPQQYYQPVVVSGQGIIPGGQVPQQYYQPVVVGPVSGGGQMPQQYFYPYNSGGQVGGQFGGQMFNAMQMMSQQQMQFNSGFQQQLQHSQQAQQALMQSMQTIGTSLKTLTDIMVENKKEDKEVKDNDVDDEQQGKKKKQKQKLIMSDYLKMAKVMQKIRQKCDEKGEAYVLKELAKGLEKELAKAEGLNIDSNTKLKMKLTLRYMYTHLVKVLKLYYKLSLLQYQNQYKLDLKIPIIEKNLGGLKGSGYKLEDWKKPSKIPMDIVTKIFVEEVIDPNPPNDPNISDEPNQN